MRTGEPIRVPVRLKSVPRLLVVLLALMTLVPSAALAADAQTGATLEAVVGLGGMAPSSGPAQVSASISSPVLLTGRLRVRGADISVSRPVEVPAGSAQTYALSVPSVPDGSRLTVEVLGDDDTVVLSETLTVRTSNREQMTVGVVGSDGLVDVLGRVRSSVTDRTVAAFGVDVGASAANLEVLDYLVVGPGGAAVLEAATEWVESGGRVVLDSAVAPPDMSGDDLRATGVDGVTIGRSGSGWVMLVDGLETRDADDLGRILRPTPIDFTNSPEGGMVDQTGLITAASDAGSRTVPSLPWLLFAILGFAFVVGPVNFIVLSRMRKRDWAWVTIPAISMLAVAGFWVAGRQRISGTDLSHASVVVAEGRPTARSAVIIAAGVEGERQIDFAPDVTVYPEHSLFGSGGTELRLGGGNTATVELGQLGYTGVGLAGPVDQALPSVTLSDGRVTVENDSDLSFFGWGVIIGPNSVVSPDTLAPGAGGFLEIPDIPAGPELGFTFIDNLMNRRGLWEDPARANSLWPFGGILTAEADPGTVYFVGLTDDYQPDVSVDGAGPEVPGPTLVMIETGLTVVTETAGSAEATIVGTGFVNWVDWVQRIVSTDQMTVSFHLPDPTLTVQLNDNQQFGGVAALYEGWSWEADEFVDLQIAAPLPAHVVSPDGAVFVRLSGANEFGDNPLSPSNLTLEWEA